MTVAVLPPLPPQDNFGYDLPAVEAAMKKHEAIEADISSYHERIQVVVELAVEMESEGYYDTKRIGAQKDNVLRQWGLLTQLLRARRARLEQNLALQKIFQEMVYMIDWMEEMQVEPRGRGGAGARRDGPNRRGPPRRCWCPRSRGSTSWRPRTCCRSTGCWRPTSRRRPSASAPSTPPRCASPSWKVTPRGPGRLGAAGAALLETRVVSAQVTNPATPRSSATA